MEYLDPLFITEGMDKVYGSKIAHSAQFGPHLIIDMGLRAKMSAQQIKVLSLQVGILFQVFLTYGIYTCTYPINMNMYTSNVY